MMIKCPNCFCLLETPSQPHPPGAGPHGQPQYPGQHHPGQQNPGQSPTPQPPSDPVDCQVCGFTVAAGWMQHPNTCIAMAGARTTGKSIYIAVMIKQLEEHAEKAGMKVRPRDQLMKAHFAKHYLKPLYEQRNMMQATPPADTKNAYQQESLIFVITGRDGSRHHLVIRDVAGEDLEDPENLTSTKLPFFPNADAVFFLFDPLRVPQIRNQLRGKIPEQAKQDLGEDPWVVMDHTLQLIQRGYPRLAVILSKFDTLQALSQVKGGDDWGSVMSNAGAAFYRDSGPLGAPPDMDGAQLHEEVRSLLIMLNASALVNQVQASGAQRGYRFFAVSALGDSPEGDTVSPRGIAPFRCLDPLRWAMSDTGIL